MVQTRVDLLILRLMYTWDLLKYVMAALRHIMRVEHVLSVIEQIHLHDVTRHTRVEAGLDYTRGGIHEYWGGESPPLLL